LASSRGYATAVRRWQGIGPYYAMFPTHFSDAVVAAYTSPGDTVLDPFAGRGTAVFSAAHQGRHGVGVEVNPVGWIFARTKLDPASRDAVDVRLNEIAAAAHDYEKDADTLPTFFRYCFSVRTREYLVAARSCLDWRHNQTDRTAMALLLVYLHGKRDAALSNQMRQTKAMSPDYSIRWWKERKLMPPELDPVAFMVKRLDWRYARGLPETVRSEVYLGNSEELLASLSESRDRGGSVRLLFTSPPYFSVTNYHYDQWLRLWLLGGPENARRVGDGDVRGKFENPSRYRQLLRHVFERAAPLLASESTIYVRTGLGIVTFESTVEVLQDIFPKHRLNRLLRPYTRPTQTSLFGDSEKKAGEVDLVMTTGGA